MSKQRYISTKFWQDNYIIDKDPIEKLLFLYLLTNPLTNILGIYEISIKIIAFDTGIDSEMILKILERFEKDDKVKYFKGHIALKNFTKHQKDNPKINKGIEILISETPLELLSWVNIDRKRFNLPDSLYIDYGKTMNYSNSNINSNSNTNTNTNTKRKRESGKPDSEVANLEEPIKYLNQKTGRNYDPKNESNKNLVKARYNEGRNLNDFKKIIDKKCKEWLTDEKMMKFLRPSTLFSRTNFENYINEPEGGKINGKYKGYYKPGTESKGEDKYKHLEEVYGSNDMEG